VENRNNKSSDVSIPFCLLKKKAIEMNRNFFETIERRGGKVRSLVTQKDIPSLAAEYMSFCNTAGIDNSHHAPREYLAIWCFLSEIPGIVFEEVWRHMAYIDKAKGETT
jgi:hypothetical protein